MPLTNAEEVDDVECNWWDASVFLVADFRGPPPGLEFIVWCDRRHAYDFRHLQLYLASNRQCRANRNHRIYVNDLSLCERHDYFYRHPELSSLHRSEWNRSDVR